MWPGPPTLGLDTGPSPSTSSSWPGQFFPGTQPVYSTPMAPIPSRAQRKPRQQRSGPKTYTIGPSSLGPQTQGDQAKTGVGGPGQHGQWGEWKLNPRPRCRVVSAACLRPQARHTQRRHSPCHPALYGSPGTPGVHALGVKPSARLCIHSIQAGEMGRGTEADQGWQPSSDLPWFDVQR